MKVLQVLYSGLGGHGSVVTSLINADKNCEWNHSLLFYGIEEMLPAYKEFCAEKNIPFSFVKKNRGIFQTKWLAIRKAFKLHDPDIIILHSPTVIFPAWNYCLFEKKKLFVVEHTPHSAKNIAEKIASFFAILLAKKIVCLSKEYRQKLRQQFRVLPVMNKTVVIQNGIDLERFHPVVNPPSAEMHVGMIGRFSSQKNQAMIIDAAIKGVSSGQLDKTIHFHFAGNGEKLEELKRLVKDNKLVTQVHFHGLLNEEEVNKFLARLDVYVHASFAETMCTSVMQAMACGLPVLASNVPGINDIVKKDENAVLFTNGDIAALIRGLNFMKNKTLRETMGISSRNVAINNFSSLNTFSRYSGLIRE
jgi:glycosyltransferase involved in cell wall biosynthesis